MVITCSEFKKVNYLHFLIADQQISLSLVQELLTAFERFTHDILVKLGLNPSIAEIPVKVSTFKNKLNISPVLM